MTISVGTGSAFFFGADLMPMFPSRGGPMRLFS
jgi:hypothetical protein